MESKQNNTDNNLLALRIPHGEVKTIEIEWKEAPKSQIVGGCRGSVFPYAPLSVDPSDFFGDPNKERTKEDFY